MQGTPGIVSPLRDRMKIGGGRQDRDATPRGQNQQVGIPAQYGLGTCHKRQFQVDVVIWIAAIANSNGRLEHDRVRQQRRQERIRSCLRQRLGKLRPRQNLDVIALDCLGHGQPRFGPCSQEGERRGGGGLQGGADDQVYINDDEPHAPASTPRVQRQRRRRSDRTQQRLSSSPAGCARKYQLLRPGPMRECEGQALTRTARPLAAWPRCQGRQLLRATPAGECGPSRSWRHYNRPGWSVRGKHAAPRVG